MEANELKVTDLMVGDWVMSFGAPHKIVGVRTDMREPHIKTDMSDTWYEEGIENLLEPIPLTLKILEKNADTPDSAFCDGLISDSVRKQMMIDYDTSHFAVYYIKPCDLKNLQP